jgi:hypothetical protein
MPTEPPVETYDFEVFRILALELPSDDPAEAERKIKRRLRRITVGGYRQDRIDYLRRVKNSFQEEIGLFAKSGYYVGPKGATAAPDDFDQERMVADFLRTLLRHQRVRHAEHVLVFDLLVLPALMARMSAVSPGRLAGGPAGHAGLAVALLVAGLHRLEISGRHAAHPLSAIEIDAAFGASRLEGAAALLDDFLERLGAHARALLRGNHGGEEVGHLVLALDHDLLGLHTKGDGLVAIRGLGILGRRGRGGQEGEKSEQDERVSRHVPASSRATGRARVGTRGERARDTRPHLSMH